MRVFLLCSVVAVVVGLATGCYLEVPLPRTNPADPNYQPSSCQSDSDCSKGATCSGGKCLDSSSSCIARYTFKSVPNNSANTSDGDVLALAFSANGDLLATGSNNGTVKVWEFPSLKLVRVMEGHSGPVTSVDFAPDRPQLASGSDDKTVRLWDTSDGRNAMTLTGHTQGVTSVHFANDNRVLSSSRDGTLRLWDLKRQREAQQPLTASEEFLKVRRSPNEEWLVASTQSGKVLLWKGQDLVLQKLDTGAGQGILHNAAIYDIAWNPTSTQLATAPDGQSITIWDVATQTSVRELSAPTDNEQGFLGHVTSVAWSPGGKFLAASGSSGRVVLWEASTGKLVRTLTESSQGSINLIRFHPKGSAIMVAGPGPVLGLWSCQSTTSD